MILPDYKNLESIGFTYIVNALDAQSPYGIERIRNIRFYSPCEAEELKKEHTLIDALRGLIIALPDSCSRLDRLLMPLRDIRNSILRIGDIILSELELFELKRFLLQIELISKATNELFTVSPLDELRVTSLTDALNIVDPNRDRMQTFYIEDSRSETLKTARRNKRDADAGLLAAKSGEEKAKYAALRTKAVADEENANTAVRGEMCRKLIEYKDSLLAVADKLCELDFALARAKLAKRYGGVKPELTKSEVDIKDMLNPMVADELASRSAARAFTPVSLKLNCGATVITGANMGGKSVAMKTLALMALMCQCGILPTANRAALPLFDAVYIAADDAADASRGLSSFGADVIRLDGILSSKADYPLIIMDEFARGTNPEEGARLVRALVKRLSQRRGISVLATHYDGVTDFARAHYQIEGLKNVDIEQAAKRISAGESALSVIASYMDYGLSVAPKDAPPPRDALNICKLLLTDKKFIADMENSY